MKKLICIFIAALVLSTSCITAFAENASITLNVAKYNSSTGNFEAAQSAVSGDLLLVTVSSTQIIDTLSCLNIRLNYNSSLVSYVEGSAESHIIPSNTLAGDPIYNNKVDLSTPANSYIVAYWGADKTNTSGIVAQSVYGSLFTFMFSCRGDSGSINFGVTVKEIFDKTYHSVPLGSSTDNKTVQLTSWSLTDTQKTAFEKIVNVTYPDSKADIEAADSIFSALKSADVINLKTNYPNLFNSYSTAWSRYYALAENAILSVVQTEVQQFLSSNANIIALKVDDVSSDNYQAVKATYKAYQNLSGQAKARIDNSLSTQLKDLNTKAKQIQSELDTVALADASVQDFIELYKVLWPIDDATLKECYEDMMSTVILASESYNSLDFDHMTQGALDQIRIYGKTLKHLTDLINETAAADKTEKAVLDEISVFTQKWLYVFQLNSLKVGLADKTFLEKMLDDFDTTLSVTAKQRLNSKKLSAEAMLQLIRSQEGLANSNDSNSGTVSTIVVPSGGTTTHTVEKVVYRDVEKPVEVATTNTVVRQIPIIVEMMLLLAGISVLTVFIPVIIYFVMKKRSNELVADGKED